jgi:hypothetical protein
MIESARWCNHLLHNSRAALSTLEWDLKAMASVARLLFVRDAPAGDEVDLCVRMSMHDRPHVIEWDDWVKLKYVDTGKSVVCRLRGNDDPSGPVQPKRIHINSHLRDILGLKSGKVAAYLLQEFRIEKAPSWASLWYIYRYHPKRQRRHQVLALMALYGGIILVLIWLLCVLLLYFAKP